MKHLGLAAIALVILALSAFTAIPATSWKIADGFTIRFTSEDPSGTFTKFSGDIVFDPQHLETAAFDVAIESASISTGNGMKNRHARSEEWLDAGTYPEIRFRSERFVQKGESFEVTGTLELHGVSKQITIPFTFANNTFAGTFTVNRTDYNIGKTTGMANKVSKNLLIDFSVPVSPR